MKTTLQCTIFFFLLVTQQSFAQNIGINGSGANAHPSALLDVDAVSTPSLGILIPRIALQAINLAAPVTSPATSLLVYNTAVASTGTNAVSAGYYYWDGTIWVRFNTGLTSSDSQTLSITGNTLSIFNGNTVALPNDAWKITGNTGTIDGTHFIGTTDNIPFNIRVNNQKAGRIDQTLANVFLGQFAGNANVSGNSIVAIGQSALSSNSTGIYNTVIGTNAMSSNTSGGFNTAIGVRALTSNNGSTNVGIGVDALRFNTTGGSNVAIGVNANERNTTGNFNSAVGMGALNTNTTGQRNVAIGLSAGSFSANTTGSDNTFIGSYSDVLINNLTNATAIGYNAKVGQSNALILGSGGVNVGIGTTTPANRFTIETGEMQLGEAMPNTGLGRRLYFSDIANSTDPIYFQRENIALDNSHLNLILGDNIDGSDKFNIKNNAGNTFFTVQNNGNVGIGDVAPAYKLIVKSYDINTAISAYIVNSPTLTSNSATNFHGSWSTVIPNSALNFTGDLYGAVNRLQTGVSQTGSINGVIGSTNDLLHYSTANITNAKGSTHLISNIGAGTITNAVAAFCEIQNISGGTITNAYGLNIGAVNGINKWSIYASDPSAPSYFAASVGIGTSTPSFPLHVVGTIHSSTGTFSSDRRLKQNIKNIASGLSTVKKLNPVSYDWIKPTDKGMQGTQMGFIAQELEEILPSMVLTSDDEQKTKSVKYHEMLPVLVKAIQELDTKNSEQQLLIENLKKEIELLKQK